MTMEAQGRTSEEVFVTPRVNILEAPDSVRVEAELPGVSKDGVDIQVKGDELTLTARRRNSGPEGNVLVRERRLCNYRRVFALSRAVDATNVQAEMQNGVLTLTIPKAEHMKPRRISVN